MRKLIEMSEISEIICDNPSCDYTYNYKDDDKKLEDFLNKPCPQCSENLLTENDYMQVLHIYRIVNWINKWFSWITIFYSKKKLDKGDVISVHVHDGVNIKKNKLK